MTLDQKLKFLDRKAAQRHRSWCSFDPSPWSSPDGDFCTCDIRERKAIIQAAIAALDELEDES